MTTQPQSVNVTAPVNPALECVKRVLFQPFDLGKWFVIGFCAWLAGLGQSGGCPGTGGFSKGNWHGASGLHESMRQAGAWIGSNLYWLLPLAIIVAVLGLSLWVLLLWLSSRAKFMFLHCVVLNRPEVVVPWEKYAREANSLFWFRLALGLCGLIAILPLVVWGVLIGLAVQHEAAGAEAIVTLVVIGCGVFVLSCLLWVVGHFTREFVVPIQYLRGGGCVAAWRALLELLKVNLASFLLYLLFRIVLSLAIAVITVAVVLMTCCIAGCLLAIPYLGTVLILPLLIFLRAYSAYFLAQFGADWDVFRAGAQAPAGAS